MLNQIIVEKNYTNNEEHYFLGQKYLLQIVPNSKKPSVKVVDEQIILSVKANFTQLQIKNLLQQIKNLL